MTGYEEYRSAMRVIEEYLLRGQLSVELVRASLEIAGRWHRNGLRAHRLLAAARTLDAPGSVEPLLRIRLLFENQPDPSSQLVSKLMELRELYQLVQAYLRQPDDPGEFESRFDAVRRTYGSEEIGVMANRVKHKLSIYDVSQPDRIDLQRSAIAAECSAFLARIEKHWQSLLS